MDIRNAINVLYADRSYSAGGARRFERPATCLHSRLIDFLLFGIDTIHHRFPHIVPNGTICGVTSGESLVRHPKEDCVNDLMKRQNPTSN